MGEMLVANAFDAICSVAELALSQASHSRDMFSTGIRIYFYVTLLQGNKTMHMHMKSLFMPTVLAFTFQWALKVSFL